MAADGANVAITYTCGAQDAARVVEAIEAAGGTAVAIHADAPDASAVQSAVDTIVSAFGQLGILVDKAGTAIPKPFAETTIDDIDRVVDRRFAHPDAVTPESSARWEPPNK
ncbi:MAG: SDR family NAD(P)-dependent oxidoreductase [Micromonosporaceae bacterium]